MLNRLLGVFSYDVGVDLGTSNTLILVRGKGILIRQPSVVARAKLKPAASLFDGGGQILAVGDEAKRMLGKTPETIEAIRPLRGGVIADFDACEAMLKHWIKAIHQDRGWPPRFPRPRVVVGIPSGVTEVERRAVQDAALSAGAREAHLIEEPMVSAIGAGIPVMKPEGQIIADIGGGTTEIAVISLGGMVINRSLRIAGDEMTEAVVKFARTKYGLIIGETTAEELKISIGSAAPFAEEKTKGELVHVARGRDLETGLPKSIKFTSGEIREALGPVIQQITFAIVEAIEVTPPELVSDLLKHGLTMTGGGSMLRSFPQLVSEKIKMPVWLADHPQETVVRGCGTVLEKPELLKRVKVVGGLR